MRMRLCALTGAALFLASLPGVALAQEEPLPDPAQEEPLEEELAQGDEIEEDKPEEPLAGEEPELDPVDVVAPLRDLGTVGGSARSLDEEELEALKQDDPHSALGQVSGVYVRQEDAFGLRPNIGLRGASSDRSKKVTLMEDGVLFGPAPYSAPAAYYFPVMARMTGLDVYKGPGAIIFGPNTIGGALDLKTREIPFAPMEAQVDLAYGLYHSARLHGWAGGSGEWWGALAEVIHLRSDGFKEVDGGGDTGFDKTEAMLKLRLNSSLNADLYHELEAKLGYSVETSHETYLGLTDADFADNPYRRYAASGLDRMDWDRLQGQLRYRLEIGNDISSVLTAYRHNFSRTWRRFNGFLNNDISPLELLLDPDTGRNQLLYDVLTGAEDSQGTREDTIGLVSNDRSYVSQGLQWVGRHRLREDSWSNSFEVGLRLHADEIDREHTLEGFLMRSGRLTASDFAPETLVRNRGEALALSAHAIDQFAIGGLTLAPGLRAEWIQTVHTEPDSDQEFNNDQFVLLPGLGAHYLLGGGLGVLAGVHRGFSPVPPQSVPEGVDPNKIEPETSINYEAGLRWSRDRGTSVELVGFFSDYNNLTGLCSFSSGCAPEQLDRQFNAGEVNVYGLEFSAAHDFEAAGLQIPVRASYTLTQSSFQSAFVSDNPLFGEVDAGDALPYVPQHQAFLRTGLRSGQDWGLHLGATYVDEMLEAAGLFSDGDALKTERQLYLDAKADYALWRQVVLYAKVDNALGVQPIVSRRPFGARPARPFLVQGGLQATF